MTEVLVGTKKGLFVLEGDPGSRFELSHRAFAGEPVEYAVRDTRTGRLLASVTSAFYGPKIWWADDPAGRVAPSVAWTGNSTRRHRLASSAPAVWLRR